MLQQTEDPTKNPDMVERARFEQFPQDVPRGLKPGNPYTGPKPFPMMLYCARRMPNGKWATSMAAPRYFGFQDENEWGRACEAAEIFNQTCRMIVHSEAEMDAAMSNGEGWRRTHDEAMAWRQKLEDEIAQAAAERNYADKNMSPKAKAESDAFEAENFGHQAVIPDAAARKQIKEKKADERRTA